MNKKIYFNDKIQKTKSIINLLDLKEKDDEKSFTKE